MIEQTFAAIVLAICVAMLVRMLLPARRRQRIDRTAQRAWWWCRHTAQRLAHRPRVSRADAAREAQEVIDRASRKRTLH